jgi:hypothetical protein
MLDVPFVSGHGVGGSAALGEQHLQKQLKRSGIIDMISSLRAGRGRHD